MKLNFWAFLYLSLMIITIQSCVLDNNTLTPTSQFTITFEKGPLAGQNIELISSNSSYDLQFYTQKLSTKISAQPLEEKSQNSLAQSSSINWAWLGDEVEGKITGVVEFGAFVQTLMLITVVILSWLIKTTTI